MKKQFYMVFALAILCIIPECTYSAALPKKNIAQEMTRHDSALDNASQEIVPARNTCPCLISCLVATSLLCNHAQAHSLDGAPYKPACNINAVTIPEHYQPHIVPVQELLNPSPIQDAMEHAKICKEFTLPGKSTDKELLEAYFYLGYMNEYNYVYGAHTKDNMYFQGYGSFMNKEHMHAYLQGMLVAGRVKTAEWYADLKQRMEYEKSQEAKKMFAHAAIQHSNANKKNQ